MKNTLKNSKYIEKLKTIALSLPEGPGCYQYVDENEEIIYVGKAKNLRRRVYSYFSKEPENRKTAILVSKIRDIKYIVVNTEEDALLLENNLIKQWNPRYNILLKDGKTYPSIIVTNEYFPRVYKTRKINPKLGTYFGPYSNVGAMYTLLELIKNLYPIRTCREKITEESIRKNKHRVCLEYHIKNCKGPCVGKQTREEYLENIREVKEILKGNTIDLQKDFLRLMKNLSKEMRFEEAEAVRKKYLLLENFRNKSEVVNHSLKDLDVFNIESNEKTAYLNYMHVKNGSITQAFTFEYTKRLEETDQEILLLGIVEMREKFKSKSPEIIVPFPVEQIYKNIVFIVPQRGDKRKLLDLSKQNVLQYRKDRISQQEKLNPEQKATRVIKELQKLLQLEKIPLRIECFDNSNISGTDAVAACVVFVKGKPAKKEYRNYQIKTVQGPDDYASMREVVRRRYHRIKEENGEMPNLIITDGGKGQMEVVREVIEEELHLNIPIAGLAKDRRHRTNTLLYGNPPMVVEMKVDSEVFRLMSNIQNEVHRFAIKYHRNKRSKHQIESELDQIKGIGPKTKDILLSRFKSVNRIKNTEREELIKEIGEKRGNIIYEYFHNMNKNLKK